MQDKTKIPDYCYHAIDQIKTLCSTWQGTPTNPCRGCPLYLVKNERCRLSEAPYLWETDPDEK